MKQIQKTWLFVLVLTLGQTLTASAEAKAPYKLGDLPEGFEVRWPKKPKIKRRTEVTTAEEFNDAASRRGTRVVVTQSIPGTVRISDSNIEVRMEKGVSVGGLIIAKGTSRIKLRGGDYGGGGILMEYPTEYYPSPHSDEDWQIQDVLIDSVVVQANANVTALNLRGNRVAVIRSQLRGGEYAIWSDTTDPLVNTDVIIAGNVLQAEGDQATVRLVGVHNSVTVENRIEDLMLTGSKHNFRVHGESDQVFAARNLLVNAGTMFGTMPGDVIGEIWFQDNAIHHVTEDLFHPSPSAVMMLHATGNDAYSDVRSCFLCGEAPDGWEVDGNDLSSYEPAPSAN